MRINRQKILILSVLFLTFAFIATKVYAALTLNATTITSDGTLTLFPATDVIVNGNLTLGAANVVNWGAGKFIYTHGTDNTFIGLNTGNLTATGDNNFAAGNRNLTVITTNRYNTAVGNDALSAASTGADYNTAIGGLALNLNVSGAQNVAVGLQALSSNTSGNENTAVGGLSLNGNLTGGANTSIGYQSMTNNTSGTLNTALGWHTFKSNTTGQQNTAIGQQAGTTNTTGSKNTFIGSGTDAGSINLTNATAVGYLATVGCSNCLVLGGTGANAVNVGIGVASPNTNAVLDVVSTTKAFMPPRMTVAQRNAIPSPTAGMVIYQTDSVPGLRVYNGTNWMRFTETAD